ncbi:hypothetical protein ACJX0J_030625, partial [Zea mays]
MSCMSNSITICHVFGLLTHFLIGSNTIPSIPVNLDSDAEHSIFYFAQPGYKLAVTLALSSRWDKIRADNYSFHIFQRERIRGLQIIAAVHVVLFKEQWNLASTTHFRAGPQFTTDWEVKFPKVTMIDELDKKEKLLRRGNSEMITQNTSICHIT